jgi:hypothetical protein
VVVADYECDETEEPGTASYLWVLYWDSPPTQSACFFDVGFRPDKDGRACARICGE